MRFPLARRAVLAASACGAVVLPVLLTPSAAWADSPNADACSGLYHGSPPGSLAITTSPATGTVLHPGDGVDVTATWDTGDWPTPVLHKILDCLLVNGTVDYGHSSQEKPTGNDGVYRYRFTVPVGTPAGRICDRVRLSGRLVTGGDLVVQKSNTVCFSVAASGTGGPPGTAVEATTQSATPPAAAAPAPLQPAAPAPDGPGPATVAAPAPLSPEVISAVDVVPTLPRTGADVLPLARLGALLVGLGGTALAGRGGLSVKRSG
ncbi:MAG TPA: hypothetical protein VFE55_11525 [Acidimicrobiia bacterium]|nr:hypothetical protein [Acidimicrobiia bacterium]